jgi:predicted ATPase
VVVTGGPGAGKTAVLEVIRRNFCAHVAVLPESAGILFAGGFPRRPADAARRAAQRAIYHVERELETLVLEEKNAAVILCDRGTLDALAYWPAGSASFLADVGTTEARELARYSAVIHLRTPPAQFYNHQNPLRVETAESAAEIDLRIAEAWVNHPRRFLIESTDDFIDKVARAIAVIRDEVPLCCRSHPIGP